MHEFKCVRVYAGVRVCDISLAILAGSSSAASSASSFHHNNACVEMGRAAVIDKNGKINPDTNSLMHIQTYRSICMYVCMYYIRTCVGTSIEETK